MTGAWKNLDGGVMLWVPSFDPDVAATQDSMSKLSVYEDEVYGTKPDQDRSNVELPSIKDLLHSVVESDSEDGNGILTPDSCTLAADSGDDTPAPGPLSTTFPCTSTANSSNDDLYTQLRSFAGLEKEDTASSDLSSVDYESDSDRTDFLESRTPCPNRTLGSRPRETGVRSHYFKQPAAQPVRRILNFNSDKSKVVKKKSPRLKALEYSPTRRWTYREREFLCVIWRWFETAPADFTACFNRQFSTDLKMAKVDGQFRDVRLYGPEAYPVYHDVYSIPFHDPENRYAELRHRIVSIAQELGIELHHLEEEEPISTSAKGAVARAPRTRQRYKSLVGRAFLKACEEPLTQVPPLGSIALNVNAALDGHLETFSDVDDSSVPSPTISKPSQQSLRGNRIAFRVWDSNSRTKFSEQDGFVSEAHALWRGDYLPPFSGEGEGRNALMFLQNIHLCMKGGGSASSSFVSVSVSLLQVLAKHASTMTNPQIAVINLNHPALQEPNKVIHAAKALSTLKNAGQAWWARYKGYAEFMIWAACPSACVIHQFPLSDLQDLVARNQSVADLLSLGIVQSGQRVKTVASQLRSKNTTLDAGVARAMGIVGKTFGMNGEGVSAAQLCCFIAALVDGFYIHIPKNDIHAMSYMATEFAKALGSRLHIQEAMSAFMDGIEEGSRAIAFYASRRS